MEAKTFSCLGDGERFVLRESHKRWERELSLSRAQANWIAKGLLDQNNCFGASRRKEVVSLDRSKVVLIEGSNSKGVFLSIQLNKGRAMQYIIVTTRKRGTNWRRVTQLLEESSGSHHGRHPLSPRTRSTK